MIKGMTGVNRTPYAVRHEGKPLRYYATRAAAERAMARSDYADLYHWDGKGWKQEAIRAVFRAKATA